MINKISDTRLCGLATVINQLITLRHYSCISRTLILHVDICFTEHYYCIYLWTYHTYPVSHRDYYFNHISPLHRYYYMWHHLCLLHVPLTHGYVFFMFHWYTDTPIHWIPSSSLPGCFVQCYIMFVYHCYMYSLVYMHVLFLYFCHMDHYL